MRVPLCLWVCVANDQNITDSRHLSPKGIGQRVGEQHSFYLQKKKETQSKLRGDVWRLAVSWPRQRRQLQSQKGAAATAAPLLAPPPSPRGIHTNRVAQHGSSAETVSTHHIPTKERLDTHTKRAQSASQRMKEGVQGETAKTSRAEGGGSEVLCECTGCAAGVRVVTTHTWDCPC